jgi:hypothetical protein
MSIDIRKVSETATSITLGWVPVAGADGYRFYSAGVLRSKTMDPSRDKVQFSKGAEPYRIEAVILTPIDEGVYPAVAPPAYKKVAPRVAFKQGGSDARFCTVGQPGVVQEGGAPPGHTIDESGATYDENGLCKNGLRSDGPALTGAREINGRPYCELPTMGDPTKNTGSWQI